MVALAPDLQLLNSSGTPIGTTTTDATCFYSFAGLEPDPARKDTVRKAGVPNAMVTMSWTRFAHAVAEALPPGTFDVIITGDEVEHGKPHPEPYLTAAAGLGQEPGRCLALEDSPTGVRYALAASCFVVAIPHIADVDLPGVAVIAGSGGASVIAADTSAPVERDSVSSSGTTTISSKPAFTTRSAHNAYV